MTDSKETSQYIESGDKKYDSKDYQGAIDDYTKAIDINPNDSLAFGKRGWAKDIQGYNHEAIDDYSRAIEIDPKDWISYHNRACCKKWIMCNEEAILDFNKAIDINPNSVISYMHRAVSKQWLNDHKGCIEDSNKAIEIDPKHTDIWKAYMWLATSKVFLGDYLGALGDCNKWIEIKPKEEYAYLERGDIMKKLNMMRRAIKDWKKAVELSNYEYICEELHIDPTELVFKTAGPKSSKFLAFKKLDEALNKGGFFSLGRMEYLFFRIKDLLIVINKKIVKFFNSIRHKWNAAINKWVI